jgi:hypothetical protein
MSIIIKIGITTGVIILVERAGFEYHPLIRGREPKTKRPSIERDIRGGEGGHFC